MPPLKVALRGPALLTSPRLNKGTAFTIAERKAFGLTGRLPSRVNTLDEQCDRAYRQLQTHDLPIGKNAFLQSMKVLDRQTRRSLSNDVFATGSEYCALLHLARQVRGYALIIHISSILDTSAS